MIGDRSAPDDTVPIRRGEDQASAPDESRGRGPARPRVLEPGHVSGAGRRVPVVYGARPVVEPYTGTEPDAGGRLVDDGVEVAAGSDARIAWRASLPSLERRESRARTLTLVAYAALTVISVIGLCAVAVVAFG